MIFNRRAAIISWKYHIDRKLKISCDISITHLNHLNLCSFDNFFIPTNNPFYSIHLYINWANSCISIIHNNKTIEIFSKITNFWLKFSSNLKLLNISLDILRSDHKTFLFWIYKIFNSISTLLGHLNIEWCCITHWSSFHKSYMNCYLVIYHNINSNICLKVFMLCFHKLKSEGDFRFMSSS